MSRADIVRLLQGQRNAAYVLITCGQPTDEGKMEVELSYEGDVDLAGYLIENAQNVLDQHQEECE